MPKFKFVNRAYELDRICKPAAQRFIVIDGAPGYGKTHLLHQIKESYEGNRQQVWKVALVDLKSNSDMTHSDPGVAWPCIASALIQQFGPPRRGMPGIARGSGAAAIAGVLVPFLAARGINILLLFDGVEVLPFNTSVWLKQLISDIDQGIQKVPYELRAVFAGRHIEDWGRGAPYSIETIRLSPFDRVAVRDMVEQVTQAHQVEATPGSLSELAWWVLYISGGHPGGICDVLDVLSSVGFIFSNLEYVFTEMEFVHGGQKGTLFELCVDPIIEELVEGVDPTLRAVLETICPVRCFDAELLDALIKQDIIPCTEHQASWNLIRALRQTHLIKPPTDNPMYSDQIVRRMLAVRMQIREPERYQKINQCAQEIFDKLARSSENPEIQRVAIRESLYHALQLEPSSSSPGEIQAKLEQQLKEYLSGIRNITSVFQLKHALSGDHELINLIEWRATDGAVRALLDIVDRHCLRESFKSASEKNLVSKYRQISLDG